MGKNLSHKPEYLSLIPNAHKDGRREVTAQSCPLPPHILGGTSMHLYATHAHVCTQTHTPHIKMEKLSSEHNKHAAHFPHCLEWSRHASAAGQTLTCSVLLAFGCSTCSLWGSLLFFCHQPTISITWPLLT